MNPEAVPVPGTDAWADANPAVVADLRRRLQASQEQERAARAEARRLGREMLLARRLLAFSFGQAALARDPAGVAPRLAAALLEQPVYHHIESCRNEGAHTTISGWAFRPDPAWDGRETTVTLLFHGGGVTYYAATIPVARPDLAAHYTSLGATSYGGARGLEGAGFACKVLHESLPADVELKIALRLECAGLACEQPTASRLRL